MKEQLKKLELQETDRDENKTIALGTSKLNYLDPRISVAWYDWTHPFQRPTFTNWFDQYLVFIWPFLLVLISQFLIFSFARSRRCKKYNVPIEKIYNKTQRDKFRWAIEMAEPDYEF